MSVFRFYLIGHMVFCNLAAQKKSYPHFAKIYGILMVSICLT